MAVRGLEMVVVTLLESRFRHTEGSQDDEGVELDVAVTFSIRTGTGSLQYEAIR